jgi:hypothetical protein
MDQPPTTIHHGHSTRARVVATVVVSQHMFCVRYGRRRRCWCLLVLPSSRRVHSLVLPGERPKHRTFSSVSSIHPMCSLLCWLFVRCFVVGPIRCFGCCCCCFVVAQKNSILPRLGAVGRYPMEFVWVFSPLLMEYGHPSIWVSATNVPITSL